MIVVYYRYSFIVLTSTEKEPTEEAVLLDVVDVPVNVNEIISDKKELLNIPLVSDVSNAASIDSSSSNSQKYVEKIMHTIAAF